MMVCGGSLATSFVVSTSAIAGIALWELVTFIIYRLLRHRAQRKPEYYDVICALARLESKVKGG